MSSNSQRTTSQTDLDILRKLSIATGGFSQPELLYDRLQELTKAHKDLEPPSSLLLKTLDPSTCHRKFLWSFALGIPIQSSKKIEKTALETKHRDERQVELDVNRSFVYYPKHVPDQVKNRLRETLNHIIVTILRRFPKLNYFQGYHDIVSIFLLNFLDLENLPVGSLNEEGHKGKEKQEEKGDDDDNQQSPGNATMDKDLGLLEETVQKFTLHRIRDSMTSDLSPIMGYLRFTQAILKQEKPGFASLISQTSSLPLFSLSWILTLTSHDLTSLEVVSRLFDFLLCHPPVMICYLACAICLVKTDEVDKLVMESEAEGSELDLDMIHFVMSSLPPLTMDQPNQHITKSEAQLTSRHDKEKNAVKEACDESEDPPKVLQHDPSEDSSVVDWRPVDEFGAEITSATTDGDERPTTKQEQQHCSKRGVWIEEMIQSALALYRKHEPIDGRLELDKIMGPKSCIHTWRDSQAERLTDQDAEQILDLPLRQIVLPMAAAKPRKKSKLHIKFSQLKKLVKKKVLGNSRGRHHQLVCMYTGFYLSE
ncbi:hypothetical protein VP01_11g11 [Puccinia sorghi]|uniref:Rab-GAP TBC domain-containing protein n=1 Tax=Puccinia sorghi TaxID=27349 RepID=A0A0L6VQK6_9BASI|nr:hypothetical protein VP01_11g11 [Puccinia sorghi]